MAVSRLKMTARRLSDVAGYNYTSHYPLVFCLPLMVGLFVVFGCGNRWVPELVLIPMSPWLTGYWPLLILQVGWLLGYTGRTVTCLLSRLRPAPRGRAMAGRRI
jgi:hypothetical protein